MKSVFIFGAGKVGRALARAIRAAKGAPLQVTLHPARRGLPKRPVDADLLILAVRDRDLGSLSKSLADAKLVSKRTACVHAAGAATAEAIAPLRAASAGVAQMHPMISFASTRVFPTLARGHVHVKGDGVAEQRARALAKLLGMTPRTFAKLDTVGYHAAAGLVANGAAALAAVGAELLAVSGVPAEVAPKMLGPLLRSVAENVEALGFPDALTGPVRRGDPASVEKHLGVLRERLPRAIPLYLASVAAQLPLARAIAEAPPEGFDAIAAFVARAARSGSKKRPARRKSSSRGAPRET
jgi:predicted short-subunit dehydrogenase-like oxidoreductase (DUF2520 family)